MPIVFEDIDYPGGTAPQVEVQVTLAGANCAPLAGSPSVGELIMGSKKLTPGNGVDFEGYWEIDLVGNDAITPAGTVYRITRRTKDGAMDTSCISVPVSGGPFGASTLEVVPPGEVPASGVTLPFLTARERELSDQALAAPALARIRAALARIRSGTAGDTDARSATIALLGDSLTEAFAPTKRGLMWTRHAARRLNGQRLGGVQYIPSAANTLSTQTAGDWPGSQPPWTYSAAPAGDVTHGGDLHAVTMVSGSTATLTFFGEVVTVLFTRTPGGPAAAAVTLDGVSQTAIAAQGTELPGQQATYVADGYGFHTLVVTSTSGQLLLEGAMVHDNELFPFGIPCRAVRTPAFGHAGFSSQFFADNTNWANSVVNATTNSIVDTYPGLIVIGLGANPDSSAEVFESNLVTIMQRLDDLIDAEGTTIDPGFLLLGFATVPQAYVDAMWSARDLYGQDRVGVLDLRRYLPGGGATWDGLDGAGHPNDAGQRWIADRVVEFIDPALPHTPAMRPGGPVIEAGDEPAFRSNWPLLLNSSNPGGYDETTTGTGTHERRHREWFEPGTYSARLRSIISAAAATAEVLVAGTSLGTASVSGTSGNAHEATLASFTIDSPGAYPVVVRKTGAATGAYRFNRLHLRKTA